MAIYPNVVGHREHIYDLFKCDSFICEISSKQVQFKVQNLGKQSALANVYKTLLINNYKLD